MIGTTQFVNSLVERKNLLEVAVLRLASPSGHSVEPKIGWPEALAKAVGDHTFLLPGGYEFDGREISVFDEKKALEAAKEIKRRGLAPQQYRPLLLLSIQKWKSAQRPSC